MLAASAGANVRALIKRQAAAARSGAVRRQRQGRGDCGCRRREPCDGWSIFNHELSPAQERNLEKQLNCRVDRPHQPDPRYFRPARAQPRGQAAGRAGAARASGDAPGARLDPPGAAKGRHRHARARAKPSSKPTAGCSANASRCSRKNSLDTARPARSAAPGAAPRQACCRCRWSAIPTPAKSRCSIALTRADAYAADQLFATLDTTTRRVHMPGGGAAGRHVRHRRLHPRAAAYAGGGVSRHARGDGAGRSAAARGGRQQPDRDAQIAAVNTVLAEIGAARMPQVLVYNKIDLTARAGAGRARRIW